MPSWRSRVRDYLRDVRDVFMIVGALGGTAIMALVFFVIVWSIPLAIAVGILKLCGVF